MYPYQSNRNNQCTELSFTNFSVFGRKKEKGRRFWCNKAKVLIAFVICMIEVITIEKYKKLENFCSDFMVSIIPT